MHIIINGMFWHEPNTGSGQYLHGLWSALPSAAPQHSYTLIVPTNGQRPTTDGQATTAVDTFLLEQSSGVARPSVFTVATPFDRRNANLAKLWFEQVTMPRAAAKLGADILFVPYAAAPIVSPVPVVTTIHDIIWYLLPEYRGNLAFRAYARLVVAATRRAAHILADSEHSRHDIITHLEIEPARISTVLLAAGPQYKPIDKTTAQAEAAARYGLHGPFVYYVGGLDARKNIPTLLRAWAMLRRAGGPEATLAVAGRALGNDPQLFPDIDGLIAELGIAESVRRVDVPREDNPLLYNAATAFAFPSRYEGFGLGPLEAMACGTPVVCSNASSLPEVTGDAALLVAPGDVTAWAGALWRILADAGLRADLRERGKRRAAMFDYLRVAKETIQALEGRVKKN